MAKQRGDHDRYTVKVLEKAMKVLDVFSREESALTLDELTKRTKLDKSTVYRILRTMEKNGYIRFDAEDGFFRLGLRFMDLGAIVHGSTSVRRSAAPFLDALAKTLKATVLVGIIIDDQFSYIDKREGDSILRIPSYLGPKMHPADSFLGLTLLSFMDQDFVKQRLEENPIKKQTDRSITRTKEVLARLRTAGRNGYFLERGEFFDGVVQIGTPIRGADGRVVAALGVSLQEFRVPEEKVPEVVHQVQATSALISGQLGARANGSSAAP